MSGNTLHELELQKLAAITAQPHLSSTSELITLLEKSVELGKARLEAYEERAAIQEAARQAAMQGKTTTDYAIQALSEPDTRWGKHAVARAWIRNYEPHVRVFAKINE